MFVQFDSPIKCNLLNIKWWGGQHTFLFLFRFLLEYLSWFLGQTWKDFLILVLLFSDPSALLPVISLKYRLFNSPHWVACFNKFIGNMLNSSHSSVLKEFFSVNRMLCVCVCVWVLYHHNVISSKMLHLPKF